MKIVMPNSLSLKDVIRVGTIKDDIVCMYAEKRSDLINAEASERCLRGL